MAVHSLKIAFTTALFATTAITAPAQAQEYVPPAAPPIRETIDENGVDLTRGALVSRSHSVSIGGPGRMGLSWSRSITSTGDFRDSTAIFLNAGTSTITVSIGASSESFTKSGSNYISNEKTGATLTLSGSSYTFTSGEGVVYTFVPWAVDLEQYGGTHQISAVVYPTGERLTFNYEDGEWCIPNTGCQEFGTALRLISVEANNGYMLAFDFAANTIGGPATTKPWMTITKVTARNMSVDPASQSWPTLTLTGVTSFSDSLNRTTTYSYTSGLMTGVKRPGAGSNSMTIAYSSGKVSKVTNEGVVTNYSYADASGVRTTTISDLITGNRVVKTNLSTMLVTSDANELPVPDVTTYEYYTDSGLLKKVTAPEGNSAAFEYDGRGNRTMTTLNPKSGTSTIVTTANYPASDATQTWKCASTPAPACNKPLKTTDARGKVTDYVWNQTTGEPTKVTLPPPVDGGTNRPETRYSYSSLYAQYRNTSATLVNFATPVTRLTGISTCQNTASCAGAADEAKSTITYGTANVLPVSIASGSGNGSLTATTAFTHDTVGNRLTVDGPLTGTADTTRTRYDAARQVIGVIGPDPDGGGSLLHRAQRMTYNDDGQVTKAESGTVTSQTDAAWANFSSLEAVDTAYDANARPMNQKLTGGGSTHALTQASYDQIGRLECTAQRMNTAEFSSPPASACTLDTLGSFGPDRITKMTYDAASRPLSVTTGFATTAAATDATVTYTSNGKVATIKDANNNVTTSAYDGFDRLTKTSFPDATATTGFYELTLDPAGNVTGQRLRDGTSILFTYDNLNRLKTKAPPGGEPLVTYAYDNLSRLTSAGQTGNTLTFTYDALSRNLAQHGPIASVTSIWDLAGRRTQLVYPYSGLNVVYDYLVTGDMTKVRENGATSGVGVLATYAYDNLGRRTSVTFGNGVVQAYGFDAMSRLTSLTNNLAGTTNDLTATFTYNPAIQIATTTRAGDTYAWTGHVDEDKTGIPNNLNQLTSYGGLPLSHDTKGNVTSFNGKTFAYTSENSLKTAAGSVAATLTYDPAMRLYQVTSGTSTKFAYDGLDRIAEFDGNNALLRRYVHGPGVDEPIVWYEGSGLTDRRFLSADERGSIISVTDSAGTLLAINKYDEFGQPQSSTSGAGTLYGKWGYTGQAWIPEIGEYYYKARVYDPELGRFLQPDPIGYEGGMNLYAYVGNDPVNFIDPLGLALVQKCRRVDVGTPEEPISWTTRCEWVWVPDSSDWNFLLSLGLEFVPGVDLVRCFRRGCTPEEWAWAGADVAPIGKGINLGRKSLEFLKKTCGCLEASTLVSTPDGLVPIEQIEVGDLVMAKDETTGAVAPKPVIDLIRSEPKPLFRLSLRDASGEAETFHATDDHPWKVEGQGWVVTADLNRGDRIDTRSGEDMVVTALAVTDRVEQSYNLTIADWHTFLVGEDGVVVHNACNPFKGKTAEEIDAMLRRKGYIPMGSNPMAGKGSYLNTGTGRSYHLDLQHGPPKGPHVGVNRPRGAARGALPARDYPTGE